MRIASVWTISSIWRSTFKGPPRTNGRRRKLAGGSVRYSMDTSGEERRDGMGFEPSRP